MRKIQILKPVKGEDGELFHGHGFVGPQTINVLPDPRGFLKGFTGNLPIIPPDLVPPGLDGPVEWDGLKVTQAATFVNRVGQFIRVFVTDNFKAWHLNGYRPVLLHSFLGEVKLITFRDLVIFLSVEEPPRKWDGVEGVTWLGVREVPNAPEISFAQWTAGDYGKYFQRWQSWGIDALDGTGAPQYNPTSPCQDFENTPGSRVYKEYEYRVAFYNMRGQVGKASSPTTVRIPPRQSSDDTFLYPIIEWRNPHVQEDIAGTVIMRTVNQSAPGAAGAFQLHTTIPLPISRVTDMKADSALGEIFDDLDGQPAPLASLGCVWRDWVFLSGDPVNPRNVRWCKAGQPEDWPVLNTYTAQHDVIGIFPLSKSIVVVTTHSIETITLDPSTGFFGQSRVEDTKGSVYAQTLTVYKDNVIGFFNTGFGVFDGFTFKQLSNTLGIMFEELEIDDDAFAWVAPNGDYFISSLSRGDTREVFVYNFAFNAWFRLDMPLAYCVWIEQDEMYFGGNDNIYAFDKAGTGSGQIEILLSSMESVSPAAVAMLKSITNMEFYLGSVGDWDYTFDVYLDEDLAKGPAASGEVKARHDGDSVFGVAKWDDDCAAWDAPRWAWREVDAACGPMTGESARVLFKWTGDIEFGGMNVTVAFSDE